MLLLLLAVHLVYQVAVLVLLAARSLPLGIKYVRLEVPQLLGHRGFWHVADPEQLSDVQLYYAGGLIPGIGADKPAPAPMDLPAGWPRSHIHAGWGGP